MKILKKKHVNRLFVAAVSLLLLLALLVNSLTVNAVMVDLTETEEISSSTVYSGRHSYNQGVYDGSIYRFRNVADGTYLTVSGSDDLSTVYSSVSNNSIYQKFKMCYFGSNYYQIVPAANENLFVCLDWEEPGSNISTYSVDHEWARFRLYGISNNTYVIYTNVNNTVLYSSSGTVTHMDYGQLAPSYKNNAHWVLECVNPSEYDEYVKYFIRDLETGLHLNVYHARTDEGALIYAIPARTTENEQWRLMPSGNSISIVPMHAANIFLGVDGSYAAIEVSSSETTQFYLEEIYVDPVDGPCYGIYYVENGSRKYLNVGDVVPNEPICRYVTCGESRDSVWILEEVEFDYYGMDRLLYNSTITQTLVGYKDTHIYTVKNTLATARYTLALWGNTVNNISLEVYKDSNLNTPYYYLKNDSVPGIKTIDLLLEEDVRYYFKIHSVSGETNQYSMNLNQFYASFQSGSETGEQGLIPYDVYAMQAYCENMGWSSFHRRNCTSSIALTANHPVSGTLDFNSDFFYYSGHGEAGKIQYNETDYLLSQSLPNMSNCDLAVWACCLSGANLNNTVTSLVDQSILRGAKTSIGWRAVVTNNDMLVFARKLMSMIELGYTVQDAVGVAIMERGYEYAIVMIEDTILRGDLTNIIYPINSAYGEYNVANNGKGSEKSYLNNNQYVLVATNETIRCKLYSKFLNGIPTDDCYVELYDEKGNTTSTYRSNYYLEDDNVLSGMQLPNNVEKINPQTMYYANVDGDWHLMERKSVANVHCNCGGSTYESVDLTQEVYNVK